jgi:hypothetical protein
MQHNDITKKNSVDQNNSHENNNDETIQKRNKQNELKKKRIQKKIKTQEQKQAQKKRQIEAQRKRREHEKQKRLEKMIADDDTIIKPEPKKRGRKSGRKKDSQDMLLKIDDVLDYMARNYPHLGIDKIRDKIIIGIKEMKSIETNPHLLYKFKHNDMTYYYDEKGAIYNPDGKVVGYFVKHDNNSIDSKMYMIESKNKDTRTFQEVIDSIENPDKVTKPLNSS